jgi:hypothetical protein
LVEMRDFDPKELVRLNLNDPILQGYNRVIELNDPTLQGYNLVIKTRRDRVSELTDIAFRIRDTVFECLAPGRKTKMRNIENLTESQQLLVLSYYLTKGLYYHGWYEITTTRLYYLSKTIFGDMYTDDEDITMMMMTSVELPSLCLLHVDPIYYCYARDGGNTPIEVYHLLSLYDDIRYSVLQTPSFLRLLLSQCLPDFVPHFKFVIDHKLVTWEDINRYCSHPLAEAYLELLEGYIRQSITAIGNE